MVGGGVGYGRSFCLSGVSEFGGWGGKGNIALLCSGGLKEGGKKNFTKGLYSYYVRLICALFILFKVCAACIETAVDE